MSGRVRGLFAGDAYMALEVCDTRDFDGTLSWPWPGIVSRVSVCYIRCTQEIGLSQKGLGGESNQGLAVKGRFRLAVTLQDSGKGISLREFHQLRCPGNQL